MRKKPPSGFGRFQYGLSGLFLLTTLCALLFAEIKIFGAVWIAVVWLVSLPIFFLATRIGSRGE